jgi:putative ABC transport system substrate-binding protein
MTYPPIEIIGVLVPSNQNRPPYNQNCELRVGFMSARSPEDSVHLLEAFRRGLKEGGSVEGENAAIEFRWARGDYSRLPTLAADLVSRQVAVIVAAGGDPSGLAAKAATATIPIVFGIGGDPVKAGLVESFSRPGGNVTGVTLLTNLMEPKRLGLLRDLAPGVPLIGALVNPDYPSAALQLQQIDEAAREIGQRIVIAKASNDDALETAFRLTVRPDPAWRVFEPPGCISAPLVTYDPTFFRFPVHCRREAGGKPSDSGIVLWYRSARRS